MTVKISITLDAEPDETFNPEVFQLWDEIVKDKSEGIQLAVIEAIRTYMLHNLMDGKFTVKNFSVTFGGVHDALE